MRVVITTSSLSMGVDFPHVKYAVHFGQSRNLSSHLQEAGRAGRDGSHCYNIVMCLPKNLTHCEKPVKDAIKKGLTSCAREAFLQDFEENIQPLQPLHDCCSVCHQLCKCNGEDSCSRPLHPFDSLPESEDSSVSLRTVTDNDKECLASSLQELRLSLSCLGNFLMDFLMSAYKQLWRTQTTFSAYLT